MLSKYRCFKEQNLGATVRLTQSSKETNSNWLSINDETGKIEVGKKEPSGFYAGILVPKGEKSRQVIINQKEIKVEKGNYDSFSTIEIPGIENFSFYEMTNPVRVCRYGEDIWTAWKKHTEAPNRLDCWICQENHIDLFQIGVIYRDKIGFILAGEYAWRGELFEDIKENKIVGKPDDPWYGPFDVRKEILLELNFKAYLRKIQLPEWQGNNEELLCHLDGVPEGRFARIIWFNPFGGKDGYGQTLCHNGVSAAIHGENILSQIPFSDGIWRLRRNQLVEFESIVFYGKEQKRKLLGVNLVRE